MRNLYIVHKFNIMLAGNQVVDNRKKSFTSKCCLRYTFVLQFVLRQTISESNVVSFLNDNSPPKTPCIIFCDIIQIIIPLNFI